MSASSGAYAWRFSLPARVFGDAYTGALDTTVLESNDPAVLEARGTNLLSCGLSEAQGGYLLDGAPARALYDALVVTPMVDPALGR